MACCCILTFVGSEIVKTIIGLGTTATIGGIGWLLFLRHESNKLRSLLNPNRLFILYFRGDEDADKKKTLKFRSDGTIENTPDDNEHYWRVGYGKLVIRTTGNVIYSKFKWDCKEGRLVHVNDPKLPSVMGQYIVPSYIPAAMNPSIYRKP